MIGTETDESDNRLSINNLPGIEDKKKTSMKATVQNVKLMSNSTKTIPEMNTEVRGASPSKSLHSTVSTDRDLELGEDTDEAGSLYKQTQHLNSWDHVDDLYKKQLAIALTDSRRSVVSNRVQQQDLTSAKPPMATKNFASIQAVPSDRSPRFVRKHDSYKVIASGTGHRQTAEKRLREKMMSSGTSVSLQMSVEDESFTSMDNVSC